MKIKSWRRCGHCCAAVIAERPNHNMPRSAAQEKKHIFNYRSKRKCKCQTPSLVVVGINVSKDALLTNIACLKALVVSDLDLKIILNSWECRTRSLAENSMRRHMNKYTRPTVEHPICDTPTFRRCSCQTCTSNICNGHAIVYTTRNQFATQQKKNVSVYDKSACVKP